MNIEEKSRVDRAEEERRDFMWERFAEERKQDGGNDRREIEESNRMYFAVKEARSDMCDEIRDEKRWERQDEINSRTPQESEKLRQAEMKRRGIRNPNWGKGSDW